MFQIHKYHSSNKSNKDNVYHPEFLKDFKEDNSHDQPKGYPFLKPNGEIEFTKIL